MKMVILGTGPNASVIYDLEAHVGFRSPNNESDTQYVQLGFACMALMTSKIPDPQNRPVYAAVVPGAKCDGSEGDPLVKAIRAMQATRGGYQDGFISAFGAAGTYPTRYGKQPKMINSIINNIYDATPEGMWPRIDKVAGCPPAVREYVTRLLMLN